MNEKLDLIKVDGTTINVDVICYFEDTTNNKKYIYYTLNETVGSGPSSTVKIYVGKMKDGQDTPISDEEWNKLKGIMGEVLKNTPNATIKYLPLSTITDKALAGERVIAMPVSYDYINKHKKIYTDSLPSEVSTIENVVPTTEVASIPEPMPTPTPEVTSVPEPIPTPTPVTPEVVPAPFPTVETPAPITPEPVVTPEPVPPVPEINIEPVSTPLLTPEIEPLGGEEVPTVPEATVVTPQVETPTVTPTPSELKRIDINEIETKYAKMIEDINNLKTQEIEAAKRYNATIELSAMHNEQHASYVANEQGKTPTGQVTPVVPEPVIPTPQPTPTPAPTPSIETNWFDVQQPAA